MGSHKPLLGLKLGNFRNFYGYTLHVCLLPLTLLIYDDMQNYIYYIYMYGPYQL